MMRGNANRNTQSGGCSLQTTLLIIGIVAIGLICLCCYTDTGSLDLIRYMTM